MHTTTNKLILTLDKLSELFPTGFMSRNELFLHDDERLQETKIDLEYQCNPMWIYNDKGELVDNALVDELENETLIVKALDEIQEAYDNLFEDNEAYSMY